MFVDTSSGGRSFAAVCSLVIVLAGALAIPAMPIACTRKSPLPRSR